MKNVVTIHVNLFVNVANETKPECNMIGGIHIGITYNHGRLVYVFKQWYATEQSKKILVKLFMIIGDNSG